MNDPAMWKRLIAADEMNNPRAWIQWKGTNVCMDVHCECGARGHVDDDFTYFYRCWNCNTLWSVGQNVRLHKLTTAEAADVRREGRFAESTNDERVE